MGRVNEQWNDYLVKKQRGWTYEKPDEAYKRISNQPRSHGVPWTDNWDVRSGDSFFKVAGKVYGDQRYGVDLMRQNAHLIRNGRQLQPGDRLVLPRLSPEPRRITHGQMAWARGETTPEYLKSLQGSLKGGLPDSAIAWAEEKARRYGLPNDYYLKQARPQGQQDAGIFGATAMLPQANYQLGYWEDSTRLGRWYNAITNLPPGTELDPRIDVDSIKMAYEVLSLRNGDKPFSEWGYLPKDDPMREFLAGIPTPPDELLIAGEEQYAGQYWDVPEPPDNLDTMGISQEEWDALPGFQKFALGIMTSPKAFGATIGAGVGALGGLPGFAGGAVLGGTIGGYAEKYPKMADWLMALDVPKEILERSIGTLFLGYRSAGEALASGSPMFGEDSVASAIADVLNNLPSAWKAAHLTYEVAPIGFGGSKGVYDFTTPWSDTGLLETIFGPGEFQVSKEETLGSDALFTIYEQIKSGQAPEKVYQEWTKRLGVSGLMRELTGAIILDPLNVMGFFITEPLQVLAKIQGNDAARAALQATSGKPIEALKLYNQFLQSGKIPGVFDPLAAVAKVDKIAAQPGLLGWFHRMVHGITETGELKILQPVLEPSRLNRLGGALTTGGVGYALGAGLASTTGGILFAALGGLYGKNKGFTGLMSLTPAAKASEAVNMAGNNLGFLLERARYSADDVDIVGKYIRQLANTPEELARELSMTTLNSPEAQVLPKALADFVGVVDTDIARYHSVDWARDIFNNLAEILGRDVNDILREVQDAKSTDVIFRQYIDAVNAHADEAVKASILEGVKNGDLTAKSLADWAKKFNGDNAIPISKDQFYANLYTALGEHMAGWAAKWFKVEPEPLGIRFASTMKSIQSLALLGFNFNYFMNNAINNPVTLAATGLWKFRSMEAAGDVMARITPHQPLRFQAGIGYEGGGAIDVAKVYDPIRSAAQQKGPLQSIDDAARGLSDAVGFATKMSAGAERWASAQAFVGFFEQIYGQLWQEGKGYQGMPNDLRAGLEAIDPKMPDLVNDVVKGGLNQAEIEEGLKIGMTRRSLDGIIGDVAKSSGQDEGLVRSSLMQMGLYDFLKNKLKGAETADDVHKAYGDLYNHVLNEILESQKADLDGEANRIAQRVMVEGGVASWDELNLRSYDEAMADLQRRHEWGVVMAQRDELTHAEFQAMLERTRQSNAIRYQAISNKEQATYLGMAKAMGIDNANARSLVSLVGEKWSTWKAHHKEVAVMLRKFFRTAYDTPEAWDTLVQERSRMYDETRRAVTQLVIQRDDAFVRMIGDQYGPEAQKLASQGTKAARDILEEMMLDTQLFVDDLHARDLNVQQRDAAWIEHTNFTVRPQVMERLNQSLAWVDKLNDLLRGSGTPEVKPEPTPQAPTPAQLELQLAPKAEPIPQQAAQPPEAVPAPEQKPTVNVRMIASEYGIATAASEDIARGVREGDFLPGADIHIKNIIEKYGGERAQGYDNIDDIPLDVVKYAFDRRKAIKDLQMSYMDEVASRPAPELSDAWAIPEEELAKATVPDEATTEAGRRLIMEGRHTLPEGISQSLRTQAEIMMSELTAGGLERVPHPEKEGVFITRSTNPDWYQSLYHDEGITNRNTVINALQRIIDDDGADVPKEQWKTLQAVKDTVIGRLLEPNPNEGVAPHPGLLLYLGHEDDAARALFDWMAHAGSDEELIRLAGDAKSLEYLYNKIGELTFDDASLEDTPTPAAIAQEEAAMMTRAREAHENVIRDRARAQTYADQWAAAVEDPKALPAGDARELYREWVKMATGGDEGQVDAWMRLMDARARRWGAENNTLAINWWKEKIGGMGQGDGGVLQELYQLGDQPIWYSRLAQAAEAMPQEKMQASQLAGWIRKQRGVKADELFWTGLDEWLKAKGSGKVTRQEVTDFLRQNQVEVKEVVLGKGRANFIVTRDNVWMVEGQPGIGIELLQNGKWKARGRGGLEKSFETLLEAKSWLDPAFAETPTKFPQYTEPGGENYRELLLTLPTDAPEFKEWNLGMVERWGVAGTRGQYENIYPGVYRSTHWDEPNVLAHVRFDERIDADGKRVLFVEEVQSDWHQAGREKGYRLSDKERTEMNARVQEIQAKGESATSTERVEWADLQNKLQSDNNSVSPAPFAKTWPELTMKRMLRWAAENGFDRVAWTTGEMQAARYDLSKRISELAYWKDGGETWGVSLLDTDGNPIDRWNPNDFLTIDDLESQIGKDVTRRIINDEGYTVSKGGYPDEENVHYLSDEGLAVGGEGMRAFYDRMLPKIMEKYGKKWGVKVGETYLPFGDKRLGDIPIMDIEGNALPDTQPYGLPVHALDVTPEMRRSVMEGQPLFQGAKGAIEFMDDGRAILKAFEGSDFSTVVHETGHIFRRDLNPDDARIAAEWAGAKLKDGEYTWARKAEEKFAKGFEKYITEGVAPTSELAKVFESFKRWMMEIYRVITGSQIDVKLTDEMRGVFDRLFDEEVFNANKQGQLDMFGKGEDTPLFSGTAQRARESVFRPQEQPRTDVLPGFEDAYKPQWKQSGGKKAGWIDTDQGPKRLLQSEYWMAHRPPDADSGAPLHDLTGNGRIYPDDVYGPMATQYYGHRGHNDPIDRQTVELVQRMRGKPNADVMIYRAVPEGIDATIEPGDWVTINKNYAIEHGEGPLRGSYQIISKKVRASEVFTNGDSIHEYGYWPEGRSASESILYQNADGTIESAPLDGEAPKMVGAPLGTLDSIDGTHPPFSRVTEESWHEYLYPLLRAMEETHASDTAFMPANLIDETLNVNTGKQLKRWLSKVYGQQADTKLLSLRWAENRRDAALHNYQKRRGLDTFVSAMLPYQFWYTRSMAQWALRALDRPAWFANYARLRNVQNKFQAQAGFPSRLLGKMRIPMPFLPKWAQGAAYVDPWHQIFPVEQLARLYDEKQNKHRQVERQTMYVIQNWLGDETITPQEAQQALDTQSGPLWEKALTEATMLVEGEHANPFDFIEMMTGYSLPLNILTKAIQGRGNEIDLLPVTRTIKAATSWMKPGGVNIEAGIRRALGAPEQGKMGDFFIIRELGNMVATSEIPLEVAKQAMVERSGPAWTMALDRSGKYQAMRTAGAALWMDFFPEGEEKQRALQQIFSKAYESGDPNALQKFFDKYPEYEARMMMSNWDKPEEMLRRSLRSQIWDAWWGADDLTKDAAKERFGSLFEEAFISKETRSYDSIPTETLATWAKMLNGQTDGALVDPLVEPEIAKAYKEFMAARGAAFQDYNQIEMLQQWYWDTPEGPQREAFVERFPQLREYWNFKDLFLAEHPELIPEIGSKKLEGASPETQKLYYRYQAEKLRLFPNINQAWDEYFTYPKGSERKQYWRSNPILQNYVDWKKQVEEKFPELLPYIKGSSDIEDIADDMGLERQKQQLPIQIDITQLEPALARQLMGYSLNGQPLGAGARMMLRQMWSRMGKPGGDLDTFIEGIAAGVQP